jgi:hypothetical protein
MGQYFDRIHCPLCGAILLSRRRKKKDIWIHDPDKPDCPYNVSHVHKVEKNGHIPIKLEIFYFQA